VQNVPRLLDMVMFEAELIAETGAGGGTGDGVAVLSDEGTDEALEDVVTACATATIVGKG
jgi:hypothetical protein